MAGSEGVLDPSTVADLRHAERECGNPEFIRQLSGIFQSNVPARVDALAGAIESRDGRTLAIEAHRLKSNCAMLGALELASRFGVLENCGDASDFAGAATALEAVRHDLPRVLEAVARLADGSS
jgi:HPt (histidine-containing phosphotransfer) domain-containing protein